MAMNFWEAQRRARSRTTIYLTIFFLLSLGTAIIVEILYRNISGDYQDVPVVGPLFLIITLAVAGFQYSMFSSYGGGYVAESMGGYRINPNTNNPKERQLLNIVEEIAIASSLPIPPIYILPAHQINAFAAGLNANNSAIAITEGSLNILNRDEIQGVIAHEFGHIYNGDMVISMRLAAMVMGFFFILYFGMRMLQFSGLSNSRDDRKGGNPVQLAALLFLLAGAFTWFMGSILKASVSREREYLADACAVQFTRNPDGIANALRKIGKESTKDMPKEGMAYSHMYLDNHSTLESLFATHPPLWKRIAAIEGTKTKPSIDREFPGSETED
jgi:heat shock protein HtpX